MLAPKILIIKSPLPVPIEYSFVSLCDLDINLILRLVTVTFVMPNQLVTTEIPLWDRFVSTIYETSPVGEKNSTPINSLRVLK